VQKKYGGSTFDSAAMITQDPNGGYLAAGWTSSFGVGDVDGWVLKLDIAGSLPALCSVEQTTTETPVSRSVTSENTSTAAGLSSPSAIATSASSLPATAIAITQCPVITWTFAYGGTQDDSPASFVAEPDGTMVIAGTTTQPDATTDLLLLKTSASGSILWQKTYGGADNDCRRIYDRTTDGGYIIGGNNASFGTGNSYIWLLRVDSAGNVLWEKVYGGSSSNQYLDSVRETA